MSSTADMNQQRVRAIVPVRVWVGVGAALLFILALATPWLAARGWIGAAILLRQFFSPVCHQDPMRSFWFWGAPAAVCARCLGIYLGGAIGVFARVEHKLAVWVFAAVLLANSVDAVTEFVGWHGNLPQVRFLLGILLGVSIAVMVASTAESKNPTLAKAA